MNTFELLNKTLESLRSEPRNRENSLAITKVQEAIFWYSNGLFVNREEN